jgi:hypothetical protein
MTWGEVDVNGESQKKIRKWRAGTDRDLRLRITSNSWA